MIPPYIFRGDNRNNGEVLKHFRLAGLYTKLINKGDPAYITKVGLFEAIRVHIAPKKNEKELQSKSHFLSFTSNQDRAMYYAADKQPEKLVKCAPYSESSYLFYLDISKCELLDKENGIYTLHYESEPNAIEPDSLTLDDIRQAEAFKAKLQKEGKRQHTLCLIDAVHFLKAKPQYGTSPDALEKATKDS